MAELSLANIINISVAQSPQGIGQYNTSNLALMTSEAPLVAFTDAYKIYLSPTEVATDFGSSSMTAKMANAVFSQKPNILAGGGYLVVIPLLALEKIDACITRTKSLVQYFGIITDKVIADADVLLAAAAVQPLVKMAFFAKKTSTDVDAGNIAEDVSGAGYDQTRILLYLKDNSTDTASVLFAAAYASRLLSVNFSGSNTTTTMHLKDLVGVNADSDMTETILAKCKTTGADVYASFQGVPKVFSTKGNEFVDRVYNRLWFVGALEVAGFNYLATVSSKIPQSEDGVSGLKSAYRSVILQALSNQYVGPGAWNSPDTFGNQEDFFRNIEERGYYIYSLPVNKQTQADREDRKAPLIQIAVKELGAIHSSSVIVNINA